MTATNGRVLIIIHGRSRMTTATSVWGGVLIITYIRSCMTVDPRIPTMPGRSTSGFHRPGRHGGVTRLFLVWVFDRQLIPITQQVTPHSRDRSAHLHVCLQKIPQNDPRGLQVEELSRGEKVDHVTVGGTHFRLVDRAPQGHLRLSAREDKREASKPASQPVCTRARKKTNINGTLSCNFSPATTRKKNIYRWSNYKWSVL